VDVAPVTAMPGPDDPGPFDLGALSRDARRADWSRMYVGGALLCLPVIAAWLFLGIITAKHESAVLAIAGAVAVGFGAFQRLGRRIVWPMAVTLAGMAVATWLGSVAGDWGWIPLTVVATLSGFAFGAMTMLGYGAWWIGMQWMIALLAYGAHPASPHDATINALAVVAGGVTQLAFVLLARRWAAPLFGVQDRPVLDVRGPILQSLARNAFPASVAGRYAMRVAIAMASAMLVSHFWAFPNGYWTPMTAAILLTPALRETVVRGINRFVGTLAGAGITSYVLAWIRPDPVVLGCVLLVAVWGCFAFQRVNYALYAVCVTAYVVLLFATVGLPQPIVAFHRVEATIAGAAIALAVHLIPFPVVRTAPAVRAV
jgi:hypothetical protein